MTADECCDARQKPRGAAGYEVDFSEVCVHLSLNTPE